MCSKWVVLKIDMVFAIFFIRKKKHPGKSHWVHWFGFSPTVYFWMFSQIAFIWRCIIALVAFVWLFSTVRLQMSPQIACLRGCIITLVAFVWLFCTVCLQISLLVILCFILTIFFIDIVLSGLIILKVFICHSYWSTWRERVDTSPLHFCLGTGLLWWKIRLFARKEKWKCVVTLFRLSHF